MVRGCGPVAQATDQIGDVGPLHVGDLRLAERGQDMGLERDPVTPDGGWLVPRLRVLDHKAVGQFFNCRRRAGNLPLLATVGTAADRGKDVLGELAGLIDGDLAVGAERRLAPLTRGRAVREHEGLAPGGRYLAEESRDNGVPDFVITGGGSGGIDDALGELGGRHVWLLAGPGSQEPHRSGAREDRVAFRRGLA